MSFFIVSSWVSLFNQSLMTYMFQLQSFPPLCNTMKRDNSKKKLYFCNRMRPIFQYTRVCKLWLLLNPKVATIYHPSITDPYLSKTFKKISYPHSVDDACLSTQIVASLILITIVCVSWLSRSFYWKTCLLLAYWSDSLHTV